MTRGGGEISRPEGVFNSASGLGPGGGVVTGGVRLGTDWEGLFCGKSGVVFAVGGAPVRGGAEGLGGGCVGTLDECLVMLGIGLVTAVDQAGGTVETGAGSNWLDVFVGAAGAVGVIFAEAGLMGRGGRLIRSVSRFGAFSSEPEEVAESAIIVLFIVISENVQSRNLQS